MKRFRECNRKGCLPRRGLLVYQCHLFIRTCDQFLPAEVRQEKLGEVHAAPGAVNCCLSLLKTGVE